MSFLESILEPGATLGENLAMHGIEGSLTQAYVAMLLDKDSIKDMIKTLSPEQAEQAQKLYDSLNSLDQAQDAFELSTTLANFGPAAALGQIIAAGSAAEKVHQAHINIIDTLSDTDNPPTVAGFKSEAIWTGSTFLIVKIDASGKSSNHGKEFSGESEVYISYDDTDLSETEIEEVKKTIREQVYGENGLVAQAEAEARNTSSYDMSVDILEKINPSLAEIVRENNSQCLPIERDGPTQASPKDCNDFSMRSGGLY